MTIADTKYNIAVIDDEYSHREIGARFVKKMGHLSFQYPSAEDFLKDIHAGHNLDLILLDMHMPKMNGLELLAELRKTFDQSDLPILMITADSDPDCIVKAFDLGANDYIVKPFEAKTLCARLKTQLLLLDANRETKNDAKLAIQHNKDRARLFSMLTHELKTPIGIAIGFSEIIAKHREQSISPDQIEDYGSMIHDSSKQLLQLVQDVLTISSFELESITLNETECSLAQLIENGIKNTIPSPASKGIEFNIAIPDEIILTCDSARIQQAIAKVLSNAVKFSNENGTCKINAIQTSDNAIEITIHDDGVGISPEAVVRIFEPFEQGSNGLNRAQEGLGLGLPITNEIMKAHGGCVKIDSMGSSGTCVILSFPSFRNASLHAKISA